MFKIFSKMFGGSNTKSGSTAAVILCAGSSTRFSEGNESKQLFELCGKTVIERTIIAFEETKSISEIVLVVRKNDAEIYKKLVYDKGFAKIKCIVTGGETRQISALRGFKHVSDDVKYVAIHDGARCLITPEIIEKIIEEAKNSQGCATAASKVTDTVKLADDDGYISQTLNRNYIWNVQTPQVFEYNKYQIAALKAKSDGIEATDDCMLAEYVGFKVKLVDTGNENIKITVKEDINRAEAILLQRGEEKCE